MPVKGPKKFLDDNQVAYELIAHGAAYTAPEIARSAHVPGRELAKTIIVELDGLMAMAVSKWIRGRPPGGPGASPSCQARSTPSSTQKVRLPGRICASVESTGRSGSFRNNA
jgi:hypothetical protein